MLRKWEGYVITAFQAAAAVLLATVLSAAVAAAAAAAAGEMAVAEAVATAFAAEAALGGSPTDGGGGGGGGGSAVAAPAAAASTANCWPLLLGYGLLTAVLLEALIILFEPFHRWRLRHIPGPPARPLVGCMPQLLRTGRDEFYRQCHEKYGPVFKVALGRRWAVVIADAELMRQAGFKLRNHIFVDASLLRGTAARIDTDGILLARDDYWRRLRAAWQPAFTSGSLSGYMPRMVEYAGQLAGRLEVAAGGEAGGEAGGTGAGARAGANDGGRVNMLLELGKMTLQMVGSTACGIDFLASDGAAPHATKLRKGSAEAPAAPEAAVAPGPAAADTGPVVVAAAATSGRELMEALGSLFHFSAIAYSSMYTRINRLVPELRLPLSWLANLAPDEAFRSFLQARMKVYNICLGLVRDWRPLPPPPPQQQQQQQQLPVQERPNLPNGPPADGDAALIPNGSATAAAPSPSPPPASAAGSSNGATKPAGGRGASLSKPGSFLDMALTARDKTTGEALEDYQVAIQVYSFILAGYETTSNALTFAVYGIATNPEVERRLLAEIDEVLGPDRPPTEADLPRLPYTEAVFNEALRLYPPGPAISRLVEREPIQLGDYKLPVGTPLVLSIYATHRDPRVWPRAEEFIPERFLPSSPLYPEVCSRVPNAHVPFGYGIRMCTGWRFALQEGKVALARLYQRLVFELEPGQVPLATVSGVSMTPRDGLWVRPVLRHQQREKQPA